MRNNAPVTKEEFERLESKVDDLTASTKALVEAWQTATGVVKFVKYLSTFIAAVGTVWFFVTHGFTKVS
jgi:hypothetical protein